MPEQTSDRYFRNTMPWVYYSCAKCGVAFAVLEAMDAQLRKTGRGFRCPNGHSLSFERHDKHKGAAETDSAELERRRQRVREIHDAEQAEARAEDLRGRLERVVDAGKRAPDGPPPFQYDNGRIACAECGRTYKYRTGLAKHYRQTHNDPATAERVHTFDLLGQGRPPQP